MAGSCRRFPFARRETRVGSGRARSIPLARAAGARAIARDRGGSLRRRIAGACRHALDPHLHRRLQRAHCRVRCRRRRAVRVLLIAGTLALAALLSRPRQHRLALPVGSSAADRPAARSTRRFAFVRQALGRAPSAISCSIAANGVGHRLRGALPSARAAAAARPARAAASALPVRRSSRPSDHLDVGLPAAGAQLEDLALAPPVGTGNHVDLVQRPLGPVVQLAPHERGNVERRSATRVRTPGRSGPTAHRQPDGARSAAACSRRSGSSLCTQRAINCSRASATSVSDATASRSSLFGRRQRIRVPPIRKVRNAERAAAPSRRRDLRAARGAFPAAPRRPGRGSPPRHGRRTPGRENRTAPGRGAPHSSASRQPAADRSAALPGQPRAPASAGRERSPSHRAVVVPESDA